MGRGEQGEEFSGTTVEETWTKPRGRVETGEGGLGGSDEGKMQTTVIE